LGIFYDILYTRAVKDLFANKLQRLADIPLMLFTLKFKKWILIDVSKSIFTIPTHENRVISTNPKKKKLIILSSTKVCC
jgi:hypothetical protein